MMNLNRFFKTSNQTRRIMIGGFLAALCSGPGNASTSQADGVALAAPVSATAKSGVMRTLKSEMKSAATPAADDQFQVGSMHVTVLGNPKGRPVILIPGLSSGAYVWADTVEQLKHDHRLYLVTLAGFDGRAAVPGPMLEKARQSLLDLILGKKIEQPVLIGHSLGATLSIWFAGQQAGLIRGVFAVDGLPVFPRTEHMSAEQRQTMAQRMKAQMAAGTQEMFAANQLQYMQNIGVVDPALAQTIAARSATSDRAAVAQYMSEVLAMDIRKDLPAINVPLAIVVPYHAPDMAPAGITEQGKAAYYGALLAGAPKLQVLSIKNARHFVMLDQPRVFAETLAGFMQTLK